MCSVSCLVFTFLQVKHMAPNVFKTDEITQNQYTVSKYGCFLIKELIGQTSFIRVNASLVAIIMTIFSKLRGFLKTEHDRKSMFI